jgi:hypothetical protein
MLPINSFTCFLDITYRKIVDVTNPKINECVILRCENINKFGDNIPIHATKIVSKSGEIPPKAPASLFLLFTAVKIIYGTRKCVNKSMTFHPKNIFIQFLT